MSALRGNTHSGGSQISNIVPFGYFFALFGRPTALHLKLCGNAKFQRIVQTVHVGMHMGVDKARHQCYAVTINDGCPNWHHTTNRINVLPLAVRKLPELKNRFIIITGDVMGVNIRAILNPNKLAFLPKPFNLELLKQEVDKILTIAYP